MKIVAPLYNYRSICTAFYRCFSNALSHVRSCAEYMIQQCPTWSTEMMRHGSSILGGVA